MRLHGNSVMGWVLMAGVLVAPMLAQGDRVQRERAESLRFQRGGEVPARAVSQEEKREILETIAGQLRDGYVFEEEGAVFGAKIESDLEAGAFDEFDRLDLFIGELTPYLYSMSHDKHLRVLGEPGWCGRLGRWRQLEAMPEGMPRLNSSACVLPLTPRIPPTGSRRTSASKGTSATLICAVSRAATQRRNQVPTRR